MIHYEPEHLAVILRLDIPAYRKYLISEGANPGRVKKAEDDTLLVSMHKLRHQLVGQVPEPAREMSRQWLHKRGFKGYDGLPIDKKYTYRPPS